MDLKKRKVFAGLIATILPLSLMAHGVSPEDQLTLAGGGLGAYVYVGAKHMVTGYDHLLFLAGVIFFLKSFCDVLKFITVFTLGHSITLIGATYLGIQADEHLVDAVIALSVLYKGAENLGGLERFIPRKTSNLLIAVFLFGLIHGFGLSTRLQSFDLGEGQFLAKIVCFNVGVELGQIAALIPIVLFIQWWQKRSSYPAFYRAVNWYLILAGVALFMYQLHGYFTQ